MKKVGFVGLGDMGLGMAKNLVTAGFEVTVYDLREARVAMLIEAGGKGAPSCRAVGEASEAVFVMVMTGQQLYDVVVAGDGLLAGLKPGGAIIVSATVKPSEVRAIEAAVTEANVALIDTPVSGGRAGADGGTLTMMVAAKADVLEAHRDLFDAVGKNIFHVGDEIGMGQTVKASLQGIIGASFAGIFEALVLASKAGVKGETLFEVVRTSTIASPLFEIFTPLVMDRKFTGTGSQIATMYKDLGITMALAREVGTAMFATAAAFELFQAAIARFPGEDNQSIVKFLEEIADTTVEW